VIPADADVVNVVVVVNDDAVVDGAAVLDDFVDFPSAAFRFLLVLSCVSPMTIGNPRSSFGIKKPR